MIRCRLSHHRHFLLRLVHVNETGQETSRVFAVGPQAFHRDGLVQQRPAPRHRRGEAELGARRVWKYRSGPCGERKVRATNKQTPVQSCMSGTTLQQTCRSQEALP